MIRSSPDARTARSPRQIGAEVADISHARRAASRSSTAQISRRLASTGQPPNDLLDQRDQLLDQLSEHDRRHARSSRTTARINVFVGSGQPLVRRRQGRASSSRSRTLTIPSRSGIALQRRRRHRRSTSPAISPAARSAGCSTSATQVLDPTRNALGRISIGLDGRRQRAASRGHRSHRRRWAAISSPSAACRRLGTARTTEHRDARRHAHGHRRAHRDATTPAAARPARGSCSAWTPAQPSRSPARARRRIRCVADGLAIVVTGTPQTGDRFVDPPDARRRARHERADHGSGAHRRGRADPHGRSCREYRQRRRFPPATWSMPTNPAAAHHGRPSSSPTRRTYSDQRRAARSRTRAARTSTSTAGASQISGTPAAGDTLHRQRQCRRRRRQPQCARRSSTRSSGPCSTAAPCRSNASSTTLVGSIGVATQPGAGQSRRAGSDPAGCRRRARQRLRREPR